ncbi:hypothetical protein D3C87_229320 [compost metagenome]
MLKSANIPDNKGVNKRKKRLNQPLNATNLSMKFNTNYEKSVNGNLSPVNGGNDRINRSKHENYALKTGGLRLVNSGCFSSSNNVDVNP